MLYFFAGIMTVASVVVGMPMEDAPEAQEQQLTFSARNHELDNNDNYSPDGRYLCYDTRETLGPGIEHGTTIEVLERATGREIVLYEPDEIVLGDAPAPGVGAVSFAFVASEVAFIHGPPVSTVASRGPYAQWNRNGGRITLDGEVIERDGRLRMLHNGEYAFSWLDKRDVATERDTLPGAHRGGTHRHEYSRKGNRIGFTYNDALLPQYDRTVGYMELHADAPAPASHYVAMLVPIVPKGTAKPGELERAYGDSWVDARGTQRAFIGVVRDDDGENYQESLFVAEAPLDVDITTADSGSAERFPTPPAGVHVRRLTHEWAGGIVRGAPEGDRIAYFGRDEQGRTQVFIIAADGSDKHPDAAMRPRQATFLPEGAEAGLRWHPDGNHVLSISDDGLVLTCVAPGDNFGRTRFLTPRGDGIERYAPVISPDGREVAYNRRVPTVDASGERRVNYAGEDFSQIFVVDVELP